MMSLPSTSHSERNLNEEEKQRLLGICNMVEFHLKDGTVPYYRPIQTDLLSVLRNVRAYLSHKGVQLSGVYLVGGAASHVAVTTYSYNDLDVLLSIVAEPNWTENQERMVFGQIRNAIHEMLRRLMYETIAFWARDASALIDKSVRILNPNAESNDAWSLFSVHNADGKNLELKFVLRMMREYQFTTDSLRIDLLPLIDQTGGEVQMFSFSGDIIEATRLLRRRLIDTVGQHEIFGGGLLKYCLLKIRNYRDNRKGTALTNLRLDMADGFCYAWRATRRRRSQESLLESFLKNHFVPTDAIGKQFFLRMLQPFLKLMGEDVKEEVQEEMARFERALYEQTGLVLNAVGHV